MATITCGNFEINYTLFTDAAPGNDVQFGMDFILEQRNNKSLCQLIFPATAVGNNITKQWNVDNHAEGKDPASLLYNEAVDGRIVDTPRELSHPDRGVLSTKFSVYIVDVDNATVYESGVKFGYSINTSEENAETIFTGLETSSITNEQKQTIQRKCNYIKFK